MIYVVTGFPRSGTSMMMRCLEFAGIKPCVHPGREILMNRRNDGEYKPNPHGWYEVLPTQYRMFGFTAKVPDGQSVKIPLLHLPVLAPVQATVIMIHRDPMEVRNSYLATFPREPFDQQYRNWPNYLTNLTNGVREIMMDRKSVTLYELHYSDVVADPVKAMSHLPIDADKAALGVDRSLYRHKAA